MAEPIPSASSAADAADDETSQNLPKNAEDRKEAAALNSLNANAMSQDNGDTAAKQPSAADQKALGEAMSRLEIASGSGKKSGTAGKKAEPKKEVEVKKKIKIASEDVNFLVGCCFMEWCLICADGPLKVEELDLTKNKATELLRAHEGDAVQAIKAFITPVVQVS